jgi:2Fe-2S ferredoxin
MDVVSMPKITVLPHFEICPEGAEVELADGVNLCEGLLEQGIKIEHACEMSKACTTCHVVVRKGFNSLEEMDDIEADLLDRAWGLEPDSRLSCQCIIEGQDLTIEIPKYTLNHAKENH